MKPSDFTEYPWNSKRSNFESEMVAVNIMVILSRTGNEWRLLPWEEYKEERLKDGNFSYKEETWFNAVVEYTTSPENAKGFCPTWAKAKPDFIYKEEMAIE